MDPVSATSSANVRAEHDSAATDVAKYPLRQGWVDSEENNVRLERLQLQQPSSSEVTPVTSYHSMPDPTPEYEGDGDDEEDRTLRGRASMPSSSQSASRESSASRPHRNSYSYRDDHSLGSSTDGPSVQNRPMLEIPEEIYAVRKAALQVLKPLTKTWVVISVGFALTVLFGMTRWTRLMPALPFWFILLPSWLAHIGLLWLHALSVQALSRFIAEANESRQRPDSRDHLNRTEYLPLLQKSLKFGLKTGVLSFATFVFEILIYMRLAHNTLPLAVVFTPLWLLVLGGIVDGLICKTQHGLRVLCWMLSFVAMILVVLKIDYGFNSVRWRVVISPVVLVLSIASGSLIYIVYGHQVGYYRLTESQLTAGNLYSLAALICIVLVIMIGEVIPLSRPVEVETRLIVVILAPLVICLVGMGAWVVSRDEFGRLLLHGGQSAVHPRRLRWEAKGWASVQGKGVTIMPMFGEVSFQPLERKSMQDPVSQNSAPAHVLEMCTCCVGGCYPYEEDEDDEETGHLAEDLGYHPYLDTATSRSARNAYNMLRENS